MNSIEPADSARLVTRGLRPRPTGKARGGPTSWSWVPTPKRPWHVLENRDRSFRRRRGGSWASATRWPRIVVEASRRGEGRRRRPRRSFLGATRESRDGSRASPESVGAGGTGSEPSPIAGSSTSRRRMCTCDAERARHVRCPTIASASASRACRGASGKAASAPSINDRCSFFGRRSPSIDASRSPIGARAHSPAKSALATSLANGGGADGRGGGELKGRSSVRSKSVRRRSSTKLVVPRPLSTKSELRRGHESTGSSGTPR